MSITVADGYQNGFTPPDYVAPGGGPPPSEPLGADPNAPDPTYHNFGNEGNNDFVGSLRGPDTGPTMPGQDTPQAAADTGFGPPGSDSYRKPSGLPDGQVNGEPISWANGDPGARTSPMGSGPGPTGLPNRNDGVYNGEAFNWTNGDPGARTGPPLDPHALSSANAVTAGIKDGSYFGGAPTGTGAISRLDGTGGPLTVHPNAAPPGGGPGWFTRLDGTGVGGQSPGSTAPIGGPTLPGQTTPGDVTPTHPGGAPGGSGQLSDADWAAKFKEANGFYDPQFNSRAAFLHEVQMGDTRIRGIGQNGQQTAPDQLANMAKYDSDARLLLKDVSPGGPGANLYNSDYGNQWATAHNHSVLQQVDQITQGGGLNTPHGQSELQWLKGETAHMAANPMRDAVAFAVGTELVKQLQLAGATNVVMQGTDIYGTAKNGQPIDIYGGGHVPLAGWLDKLALLKDATVPVAAAQPTATPVGPTGGNVPATGGGNYPARPATGGYPARPAAAPRGYGGPPAGGGGGNAPAPAAPAAGAPSPAAVAAVGEGPLVQSGNHYVPQWETPYIADGGVGGGRLGYNANYGAAIPGQPLVVGQETPDGARAGIYT